MIPLLVFESESHLLYFLTTVFNFIRDTLLKTKQSGEKNIVLDCPASKLYDVLLQAQQVGLMGEEISYIITTLVSHLQ